MRLSGLARLAVLLVASTLAVACASAGAASPVATVDVEMPASYRFSPAVITVTAGSTVTWHNHDHFTHAVYVQQTQELRNPIRPGESASITFAAPGEYTYVCTYHTQNMMGKVIVTPKR